MPSRFLTRDRAGRAPATCGARFATVASNTCRADVFEPAASVAVTEITALPPDTGVTDTVEPDTDTVATDSSDDEAPYVSVSPSSSSNAADTSTEEAPSATRSGSAASVPTGSGERLAPTVSAKVRLGSSDLPSLAVTVTVTAPAATGETVTVEPEIAAVATDSSDDVAV